MKTSTPQNLINGHKYQEYVTPETWQFFLYNNRGRVLLQYSCHKNCYTEGKANFWAKVVVLYNTIKQEKAAKAKVAQLTQDRRREARRVNIQRLEADLESLFEEVDAEQQALHDYVHIQSNTDFLTKIDRFILLG
jgi:hypothetical protein